MDITRFPTIKWSVSRLRWIVAPGNCGDFPSPSTAAELFSRRPVRCPWKPVRPGSRSIPMNGIIYLVGLIVVIMFILSFLGLR